ncbi:MAG: tyrosine--tRNA ligase, partial [Chlorobium limicola]|nr:tyrosine--tRNA ligase [Chlorobium limicola]
NIELVEFGQNSIAVTDLLVSLGAAPSKSEARRMIQQNAVTVNEEKITDTNALVPLDDEPKILKAGKRKFYKIAAKKTF